MQKRCKKPPPPTLLGSIKSKRDKNKAKLYCQKIEKGTRMICTNGESERTVTGFKFRLRLFELEKACEFPLTKTFTREIWKWKCKYSYIIHSRYDDWLEFLYIHVHSFNSPQGQAIIVISSEYNRSHECYLLFASCWLRCVLDAQLAISVSASLRIRSDLVRDECALQTV